MEAPVHPDIGRLIWRCRRGMKELDLLLTGYLRERWVTASVTEKAAFERILELPDPVLAAYLMERESPPDQDLQQLLAILRERNAQRLQASAAAATAPGLREP